MSGNEEKMGPKAKPLSELTLADDYLFGAVMSRGTMSKLFLEALLGIEIEKIELADVQKTVDNAYKQHGIRLDVYVKDAKGTIYNVEMQTTNNDDLRRRARYYQGGIDFYLLEKGHKYKTLPNTYIIFICTFDLVGDGDAVYRRAMYTEASHRREHNDGTNLYYLNTTYKIGNASAPILEFLDYVGGKDIPLESELGRQAVETVTLVKSDEEEVRKYMTYTLKLEEVREASWEGGRAEGLEEGRAEGLAKGLKEGRAEGLEEGREEGIAGTIRALKKTAHSFEQVLKVIIEEYNLSDAVAEDKMRLYW